MVNKALLIKSHKVTVPNGIGKQPNMEVFGPLKELMDFLSSHGFGMDKDLIRAYICMDKEMFVQEAKELVSAVSSITHDMVADATRFYQHFPGQALSLSETERFLYQIGYYFLGDQIREIVPGNEEVNDQSVYVNHAENNILKLGRRYEEIDVYRRMMLSPVSLSEQDKAFLREALQSDPGVRQDAIPDNIPNRENLAFVSDIMMRNPKQFMFSRLMAQYHTATDVLRLIAARNGQSTMLDEKLHLHTLPRAERRLLFNLLANDKNLETTMRMHEDLWKQVAAKYHPFDFIRTGYVREAFDHLYQGKLAPTFASKLETAIAEKNLTETLELVTRKPGEMVRRFDQLLRVFDENKGDVINAFELIPAEKFEPKLLLQLRTHMEARSQEKEISVYFPKGGKGGVWVESPVRVEKGENGEKEVKEHRLAPFDRNTVDRVIDVCETKMRQIFMEKAPLGKVYIDDSIKGYKVPMQQRTDSAMGLRTPAKGSRIPADQEKDLLRFYTWWTNTKGGDRVDVDMSLKMYDKNMHWIESYFYGNFSSSTRDGMESSGDITSGGKYGGKGAAEFIDVDPKSFKEETRYIAVTLNSFTGVTFDSFPCKFGFMEKDRRDKAFVFDPASAVGNIDVSSHTTNCLPIVYDVEEKQFIWVDLSSLSYSTEQRYYNAENQAQYFNAGLHAAVHNEIPDLYDLVRLNAEARGTIVDRKEDADVIFSKDEGITPYDLDVISADLLSKEGDKKEESEIKGHDREDEVKPTNKPLNEDVQFIKDLVFKRVEKMIEDMDQDLC